MYLDANVFMYAMADLSPWSAVAQGILAACERGLCSATTSELTLAECLVRPLQLRDERAIAAFRKSIQTRPQLVVLPVAREILVEAARVRATSAAKLPDAIHIASYRAQKCSVLVTNDRRLGATAGVNCVLVSDLIVD
ncbi:MAG: type II toxin-antitoxin system VapC family toxin [Planctomycetota bacterium]